MEENIDLFSARQLSASYKKSSLPLAIHIGSDHTIQFANGAILRNLGLDETAINKPMSDAIPGIEKSGYFRLLNDALRSGAECTRERVELCLGSESKKENMVLDVELHTVLSPDGSIIALLNHTFNVTDLISEEKDKEFSQGFRTTGDLRESLSATESILNETRSELARHKQQMEEIVDERVGRLSESEDRFRLMADGTELLIAVSNEHDEKVYYNKKWSELTGRSNGELLERGWTDLIHTDDREDFIRSRRGKKASLQSFTREFRLIDKNGEYQWMLCQSQPRNFGDGRFAGYVTSCIDITQRKLEELRKNEFISIVSHELKTPVTSLLGFIQVLQRKASSSNEPELGSALLKMRRQIGRMMDIIVDFLYLTRLESSALLLNESEFDLTGLFNEVIGDQKFIHSHHYFRSSITDFTSIRADREKLYSVFSNLLNNATKYSPYDTTVSIDSRCDDRYIIIEVCDQGPGIPDSDLTRIFDKFYRSAHHPTVSGFGIGLYLCSEIVQLHGGQIYAENIRPGCRITLRLPLDRAVRTDT